MDRRDSKKSKQKSHNKDAVKSKGEDFDDERRGKSGVMRSKPCREIYRPPIVRKGRGSNSHSENSNEQSGTSAGMNSGPGSGSSGYVNSVPNSPIAHSSSSSSSRAFNVYAKEFQYPANASQIGYSRSQPMSYFPTSPTDCYTGSILATSGCYPLQQSKSSGNVNHLWNQLWAQQQLQQQQSLARFPSKHDPFMGNKRRNPGLIVEVPKSPTDPAADNLYVGLQQSKSSGNIPGGRLQHRNGKTVRFDFHEQPKQLIGADGPNMENPSPSAIESRLSKMQRDLELTEKSLALLDLDGQKLNEPPGGGGKSSRLYEREDFQDSFRSPTIPTKFNHSPQPLLQKSHTFFHVPSSTQAAPERPETTKGNSTIKRSKSYTPRSSQPKASFNGGHLPSSPSSASSLVCLTPISASSDFEITKWPQNIQESVTTAVIGADRVPARHRINMVGSILDVLLCGSPCHIRRGEETSDLSKNLDEPSHPQNCNRTKVTNNNDVDSDGPDNNRVYELIPSAVNIFLYFIQREKDRTVMETVLNTCYATYQQLHKLSFKSSDAPQSNGFEMQHQSPSIGQGAMKTKWWTFLRLLSSMFAKLKIIRLQKSQQPGMKSVDELNTSVLSLLCDSCLLTLRSPFLHTSEIMDLLFTIMTSIGREMEGTFPMKMKQILAAVRDALLGIKPYPGCNDVSSPNVQKTLMQLIELHAANWHLPASAVRYYYSIPM